MRKQIAAANWKMNLTMKEGEQLLNDILNAGIMLTQDKLAVFAVPFPYLTATNEIVNKHNNYHIAAQNCYSKTAGAYTGEVSAVMLQSINIQYCIIGHSERREYFGETNAMLAQKLDVLLTAGITPVFCCGEPLTIREAGAQDSYVEVQLQESLFHLDAAQLQKVVIAYEPIWAIGTGKTATTAQAQEIHAHIRSVIAKQYSNEVAETISILYGGSVKAANAKELFACKDVDGGLVGGASLVAGEFVEIISALK
jgi:triosephosphate isomerase (TIM)